MADDRDIIDVLQADHDQFRRMFDELENAAGERRVELFHDLVAALASHEAAEEALVHKALRDEVPGGEELAEQVLAEESRGEELLAEVQDVEVDSTEFSTAVARLRKEIVGHAEHEERDEFPRLREHLSDERRRELGGRFEKLRAAGPTRPHPNTPQHPGVRAAVGPIVGVFDRARDAVRDAGR
ncbi:hemerythrin domain-containing protein [Egicoccus halophilus]|uniref:Hemerythrin n=1 Tax=Egicoccus halophilus TaxID=1670830 RepID=A0A8J3A953_9ACTN|nr:hemerythrin domain-containing protein [Egicoccus halophilus]GGI05148.1 hemerythrin [Egicoccus halophilus]